MSCQDWELRLAQDDSGPEVEAHWAECPSCRALAEELAANSLAMVGMGEETMPTVMLPKPATSPWRWASAVAAILAVGMGLWHLWGPGLVRTPTTSVTVRPMAEAPKPTVEPPLPVIAQARIVRPIRRPASKPSWRLVNTSDDASLIRMVTSEPDVVIYWLIEPKKEELE
jgi:hypothetical protein